MLNYAMSKGCCPTPAMFRVGPCCRFPSTATAWRTGQKPCSYHVRGDTTALIKTTVKLFGEISGLGSGLISPLKSGFNQLRSLLAYHHFSINPLDYLSKHPQAEGCWPHALPHTCTQQQNVFATRCHACMGISRNCPRFICWCFLWVCFYLASSQPCEWPRKAAWP